LLDHTLLNHRRYVHKLHHRNADPEPFSGITMHPVEHLYYFSNAFTPSLYLSNLSPLVFTWNFIHLTIAPGAGHSGWEDHFQVQ
jgi:sterol desaturase/sphingolipid hydroxylase (fatty acid hydroxylase superfamily)